MKKLLKLALLIGGITAVARLVSAKKAEWSGLTEAEVRAKLETKLPDKMPADKQAEVSDKIVAKMRERGVLREEAAEPQTEGNGGVAVATEEAAASDEDAPAGDAEQG